MDINPLQVAFGLILIFFLPGFLLVKALFPGRNELDKEYNLIYEIGLGMGLSIVIAILDGFMLGSLHQLIGFRTVDGREVGYFDTPYIVSSLLLISLALFIAAWYRGAFPWMGRLHPGLARVPASERPEGRKKRLDGLIMKIWELSRERERLRREVLDSERKARSHGAEMRAYYKKKLGELRERLAKVDGEMKELEEKRAEELAGVDEERRRKKDEREKRRKGRDLSDKKDEKAEEGKPEKEAPIPVPSSGAALASAAAGPSKEKEEPVGLEDSAPEKPAPKQSGESSEEE